MSKTLNLVDRLLAMGRLFQDMGRTQDALRILTRLAGLRNLPAPAAEQTQARLGELHLRQRRYKQARRHLVSALAHQPNSAEYHYLLATAHDQDDEGDPQSALEHYRQALTQQPDHPQYLSDYGLLAICMEQEEDGLKALRRAVDLAPNDAEVMTKLVEGLCQLERPQEARRSIRAALFRNPRHGGFHKLWSDFRFQQVREEQEAARVKQQIQPMRIEEPVLLPFLRPTGLPTGRGRKLVRRDAAAMPAPPHLPRFSDQKHA